MKTEAIQAEYDSYFRSHKVGQVAHTWCTMDKMTVENLMFSYPERWPGRHFGYPPFFCGFEIPVTACNLNGFE